MHTMNILVRFSWALFLVEGIYVFLIFQIPDNKDALFGATDEEIISIKPSLVWKIWAKGEKNSDNSQTDNLDQQQSSTSIKTETIEKENCNANERKL